MSAARAFVRTLLIVFSADFAFAQPGPATSRGAAFDDSRPSQDLHPDRLRSHDDVNWRRTQHLRASSTDTQPSASRRQHGDALVERAVGATSIRLEAGTSPGASNVASSIIGAVSSLSAPNVPNGTTTFAFAPSMPAAKALHPMRSPSSSAEPVRVRYRRARRR